LRRRVRGDSAASGERTVRASAPTPRTARRNLNAGSENDTVSPGLNNRSTARPNLFNNLMEDQWRYGKDTRRVATLRASALLRICVLVLCLCSDNKITNKIMSGMTWLVLFESDELRHVEGRTDKGMAAFRERLDPGTGIASCSYVKDTALCDSSNNRSHPTLPSTCRRGGAQECGHLLFPLHLRK
jgi:hypothetical protein